MPVIPLQKGSGENEWFQGEGSTFPSSSAHFPFVPCLSITEQLDCPCRGGNATQGPPANITCPKAKAGHTRILLESYL